MAKNQSSRLIQLDWPLLRLQRQRDVSMAWLVGEKEEEEERECEIFLPYISTFLSLSFDYAITQATLSAFAKPASLFELVLGDMVKIANKIVNRDSVTFGFFSKCKHCFGMLSVFLELIKKLFHNESPCFRV